MSETSALMSALRNVWGDTSEDETAPPSREEARRSPHVEATIEAVERAMEGRAPLPAALTAVAALKQRLAAARHEHERHQRDPQLSPAQRALGERIARVYAEESALLEEMETVVRSFQRARLEGLVDRLRRATGELYCCQDAWQAEAREPGRAASDQGIVMVPPIYSAVYEACEQVARGQISLEEWLAPLNALQDEVDASLRTVAAGVQQLGEALRQDVLGSALADEIQEGFARSQQALIYMRRYAESRQVEFLNTGWTELVAGTSRVQRAMQRMAAGEQPYTDVVELDPEG